MATPTRENPKSARAVQHGERGCKALTHSGRWVHKSRAGTQQFLLAKCHQDPTRSLLLTGNPQMPAEAGGHWEK